jgi:hypothetical protein
MNYTVWCYLAAFWLIYVETTRSKQVRGDHCHHVATYYSYLALADLGAVSGSYNYTFKREMTRQFMFYLDRCLP